MRAGNAFKRTRTVLVIASFSYHRVLLRNSKFNLIVASQENFRLGSFGTGTCDEDRGLRRAAFGAGPHLVRPDDDAARCPAGYG